LEKRNKILSVLRLLRLNMPQSSAKGVLSFLFYTCVVLTIQSLHLYLTGTPLKGHLFWILSLISPVLWALSESKTPASRPLAPAASAAAKQVDRTVR
jgi:hypothetical protein